jgi:hypothetical protein
MQSVILLAIAVNLCAGMGYWECVWWLAAATMVGVFEWSLWSELPVTRKIKIVSNNAS